MEPTMGLTFEKVWAMFEESDRKWQETKEEMKRVDQETKEEIKRVNQETKEEMKRVDQETDRQIKETARQLGALGNKLGALIEYTVLPNIEDKFCELGYEFTKSSPRVKYSDIKTGKVLAEVDILIENGDYVMLVEVKTDLNTEHVDDHVERMDIIKKYANDHNDKRKYLGAVAGGIVSDSVKNYAQKKGFYALEPSGDTVKIAETPQAWRPREW